MSRDLAEAESNLNDLRENFTHRTEAGNFRSTRRSARWSCGTAAPCGVPLAHVQSFGDNYMSLSGMSMATAVTSGAVALLIHSNSALTPDVIKALLIGMPTRSSSQ